MIDLHVHVLAGVDDGARDLRESLALARVASDAGVSTLVATPHVREKEQLAVERIRDLVSEVRRAVAEAQISIEIASGGELAHERLGTLDDSQLRSISLGGSSRYILLETPYRAISGGFEPYVRILVARGFRPLIAHPERSREFSTPDALLPLVRLGSLVQVTAASLVGEFGPKVEQAATRLVRAGLVHVVASDAHRADQRLSAFVNVLGRLHQRDPALARAVEPMVLDTPRRLLDDEDVQPPIPTVGRGLRDRLPRALRGR